MNKIKSFRNKLGLTIRELSEKSNVAVGYISTLENDCDGTTNPTKEIMVKISAALGESVPDVFFPDLKKVKKHGQTIN